MRTANYSVKRITKRYKKKVSENAYSPNPQKLTLFDQVKYGEKAEVKVLL